MSLLVSMIVVESSTPTVDNNGEITTYLSLVMSLLCVLLFVVDVVVDVVVVVVVLVDGG